MHRIVPSPARSVYAHVPFCAHKCEYCAFYSTPARRPLIDRYVEALAREIQLRTPGISPAPATLFFGGGTPSLLNHRQWERVLGACRDAGLASAGEWTVECNPATVSPEKAALLRDAGVNRISLGVQSFHEPLLEGLGRIHTRAMVFQSYEILRKAGFSNINIDLMFALPGQTMEIWRDTLREALALGTEHLSCYEIIYEEDTPLFERLKAGDFRPDENLAADMFEAMVDAAGAAGLRQYEIANFARDLPGTRPGSAELPHLACRHNVNYWRGGSYLALGPSASGFEGGRRYRNIAHTEIYCEKIEHGDLAWESCENLPPLERAGEIAAFGLRMNAGWPWEAFQAATGFDLRKDWAGTMHDMVNRGWGVIEPDRFRLSDRGLRFADAAGSEFLRPAARDSESAPSAPIPLAGSAVPA
jgi:oxygen-independent coproporphyrinogen-3 oxidase